MSDEHAMSDEIVWALEERLWLDGVPAYDEILDPACLMAFPGMGLLRAADIRASLEGAPRWSSVVMSERLIGRAGEAVRVLAYRAEAHRTGAPPYRCFCTSTYRARDEGWAMVQHQQTPAD